ncbi:glycoside hydrolase family 15 protein [Streptomyces sp. NPDC003300]|uniref:glycoside hydrolase family 15 protein n=1 Tax=unclassified Streptomyces TaxID=2593676 RepID=UPI0033A2C6CF
MRRYPPIADHGLIGDFQTSALVSSRGVVDWFCAPRFDSPSVFASLLDHDRGGYFSIAAASPEARVRQLYLPDTAVLVTRFMTPDGVGEVIDFMPVDRPETATDRHRLLRVMRVVRGTVRFALECRPRFDYGRCDHRLHVSDDGTARFGASGAWAYLQPVGPLDLERDEEDVRAAVTLKQGEMAAAVLTVCAAHGEPPGPVTVDGLRAEFDGVREFWHGWIRQCRYRGRWQQAVNRSAITLKLLTYAPTGAPVAAATMGLPEQVGGERNWDYRYTWVRDASLSVNALVDLGFTAEADAFRRWLGGRLRAGGTVTGEPLQIMYRVDGDPHLAEETLDHFEGYRGSAPVRLGNGAADQLQLDIYGEAVHALSRSQDIAQLAGWEGWRAFSGLLDWLAAHWDRADEGIWETRGGRQDFTYSRLMCWSAFDRGIRLAAELARPADLETWTTARDTIMEQVMDRGWSEKRHAFVQHYGSEVLDASLLLMPEVGFVAPKEPRWLSTLDAMDEELVSDSLVYRYDPGASPDGLRGGEGTFSLCSFLYVGALARAGRLGPARYAFDKMLTYANHVGLFAEEIGPTGEQLGNFPQAFTHLSLITAATALDEELDRSES